MPAHSSHLLQPLDISIFSPVKTAYGSIISQLRTPAAQVTKHEFVTAYAAARRLRITSSNIAAGWQAAGLIPIDAERVINKLTITAPVVSQPRLTTPVLQENSSTSDHSSQLATPRNMRQYHKAVKSAKKRLTQNQLTLKSRLDKMEKSHALFEHRLQIMTMDHGSGDTAWQTQ